MAVDGNVGLVFVCLFHSCLVEGSFQEESGATRSCATGSHSDCRDYGPVLASRIEEFGPMSDMRKKLM